MEAIFPKTALKIGIWGIFGGLKSKSGYFLGFSKKISDEHTYHFNIKSPPPGYGSQTALDKFAQTNMVNIHICSAGPVLKEQYQR